MREVGHPGPSTRLIAKHARSFRLAEEYRRVFILDSRDWFASCQDAYDPATDLVLTYDFALKRDIDARGGSACYVDHLVGPDVMQENNFLMYEFFRDWHKDGAGRDLFSYRGIPFGLSFRLDYWNDYVFAVRARLCLDCLRSVRVESFHVGTELGLVEAILTESDVQFAPVRRASESNDPCYYFPIHKWMRDNIRRVGAKAKLLNVFAWGLGTVLLWTDRLRRESDRRPTVLVQEYHPTVELMRRLRKEGRVRVLSAVVSRTSLWSRFIPIWGRAAEFQSITERMMHDYRSRRSARLVLTGGLDITDAAYALIEARITPRVAETLRILKAVVRYMDRNPIDLEVLIANIGEVVTVVDCVCRARGIPSYLIINGLLATAFGDESKYATVVNAYSQSIKTHYFRGRESIVCLGDPRMDRYPPAARRSFDRDAFTVTIGASGHNNTDLNSYLAAEFDFLADVLEAVSRLKSQGVEIGVIVKVRANGYRKQYERFAAEYFPGLVGEIIDEAPMRAVLDKTDCFISIYSQTLFEASCMGIPSVYYKVDSEIKDPPFDGRSELVTVTSVDDLCRALEDFRDGNGRYDAFLTRSVMEQYIGPLDGQNLQRNLDYVYQILDGRDQSVAS